MVAGTKTRTGSRERPVPTFDHLKKKKPVEIREWIPLDDDYTLALDEARRNLDEARLTDPDDEAGRFTTTKAAFEKARDELRAHSVEMVFRSIGRPAYEDLVRAHPPTEKQVEEHKKEHGFPPEYNAETFAPVLISASCVQPEMTPEQVLELINELGWNAGEYAHLFQQAMRVNQARRTADLGF